ncbi:hypothetical protein ACVWW6_009063 [Bradyrhizobium sp. USDA 3311]
MQRGEHPLQFGGPGLELRTIHAGESAPPPRRMRLVKLLIEDQNELSLHRLVLAKAVAQHGNGAGGLAHRAPARGLGLERLADLLLHEIEEIEHEGCEFGTSAGCHGSLRSVAGACSRRRFHMGLIRSRCGNIIRRDEELASRTVKEAGISTRKRPSDENISSKSSVPGGLNMHAEAVVGSGRPIPRTPMDWSDNFRDRFYSPGYVYIAGSLSHRVLKIGTTINIGQQEKRLRRTRYGSIGDWVLLYYVWVSEGGRIEHDTRRRLKRYRLLRMYDKEGHRQKGREIVNCRFGVALEALTGLLDDTQQSEATRSWRASEYEFGWTPPAPDPSPYVAQSWPRLFGQRPAGFKWIPAGLC